MYSVFADFSRQAVRDMAALGVSSRASVILAQLLKSRKLSCGTLALRAGLDRASLSRLMRTLEKSGLVTRKRGPKDRRTVTVRLTPHGRDIARRCARIDKERMRPPLAAAPESDAARLARARSDPPSAGDSLTTSL